MRATYTKKIGAILTAIEDPNLSRGSRLLFSRLIIYRNHDDGECIPSQETLAHNLNCTERTIRAWVRELREQRYILSVRKGRNRPSNHYDLWLPTGNSAYVKEENPGSKRRKRSSAKEEKEKKNEEEKISRAKGRPTGLKPESSLSPEDQALQALEKETQRLFSDTETGLQLLMKLSDEELKGLQRKIVSGEQSAKDTAIQLLRDVGKDPLSEKEE